jgi:ribonuclease Z
MGAVGEAAPSSAFAVGDEAPAELKVCSAFDYMRVKVGDIPKLEAFTPAFVELLKDRAKDEAESGAEDDDGEIKPPASKKAKKNQGKKQKTAQT